MTPAMTANSLRFLMTQITRWTSCSSRTLQTCRSSRTRRYTSRSSKVATYYARGKWYEHIFQLEKAEYNDKKYEEKSELLIKAIIAEKPNRTQTVFIPASDPLDTVYQPANVDEYLTRRF